MFCGKCGKKVEDSSVFCSYCGAKVQNMNDDANNDMNDNMNDDVNDNINNDMNEAIDKNTEPYNIEQPITAHKHKGKKLFIGVCLVGFIIAFCTSFAIPLLQSNKKLSEIISQAPAQYENCIMDNYSNKYDELMQKSNAALDKKDTRSMKDLIEEWSNFQNEVITNNEAIITEKQKQIEAMEDSFAYDSEKQQIEQFKAEIKNNLQSKNYIATEQSLQKWQDLLTTINNSSQPIQILVEQIDSSEFPKIRLYLDIINMDGNVLDSIPENTIQLKELSTENTALNPQNLNAIKIDMNSNLNINLVADVSGSMEGYPITQAKNAMQEFLNYIQFSIGDMVELTIFSDDVSVYQPFTSQKNTLSQQIMQLPLGSVTSLYDALYAAVLRTATQTGAKCVVAFTDGMDNNSHCTPNDVIELAKRYKIPIYIVGIGSEPDASVLQKISYETNGFYKQIYDVIGISEIYNQIYRTQKQMYLVEYTAGNTDAIGKHSINLGVHSRDWKGDIEFDFTPNVLTSIDEKDAGKINFIDDIDGTVNQYLTGFVHAINANDFSYLEDAVILDSPIAKIQKKFIQNDVEEYLQSYEITNKEMVNDDTCIVTVRETYDIDKPEEPLHMLVQEGKYILKKQNDGVWKFYDFAEPVEVLQRLNY